VVNRSLPALLPWCHRKVQRSWSLLPCSCSEQFLRSSNAHLELVQHQNRRNPSATFRLRDITSHAGRGPLQVAQAISSLERLLLFSRTTAAAGHLQQGIVEPSRSFAVRPGSVSSPQPVANTQATRHRTPLQHILHVRCAHRSQTHDRSSHQSRAFHFTPAHHRVQFCRLSKFRRTCLNPASCGPTSTGSAERSPGKLTSLCLSYATFLARHEVFTPIPSSIWCPYSAARVGALQRSDPVMSKQSSIAGKVLLYRMYGHGMQASSCRCGHRTEDCVLSSATWLPRHMCIISC
jgi:hypothetical protein